ncbi:MAG: T9SS type A sorting domain-containing protein [Salibacter sp.]|uniref:T9SS type A sorting domain-containing protein n=1 Tax=Salibacter sp. TaxID=2010995 RepID=UPI0028700D93|nr:T9SS type A sorting domain-containing protein [Salibacter sp.]MDR9397462.1 T9SS type A sorting domain-containing protein [Salibacter sp.]
MSANQVFSHSVQTFWEERNNGSIRFWLEHWHGQPSQGSLSNFYIVVDQGSGNQNVTATGAVNNTSFSNLPVQGSVQNRSTCYAANSYNNWVYYDFYPASCNQSLTITFVDGPPAETTPACNGLFGFSVTKTFNDNAAPTIVANDLNVSTSSTNCSYVAGSFSNVTVTDNCDSNPNVSYSINNQSINPSTYQFPVGSTTVDVTASDNTGVPTNNTSTSSFNVVVSDNISPTVQAQNITIQLDSNGQATISTSDVENGSSDNCTTPTLSLDKTTFDCNDLGANTVTLSADDGNGNISAVSATVTVSDSIAPSAISQDITVYLDANGQASITTNDIDNGSSDNCSISSMTLDQTSFTCADTGQNTVTLTVTDGSNNVSTSSAIVTVEDTIAPNIQTQSVTVYLDSLGQASTTAMSIDAGSSDNCAIDTMFLSESNFDCSHIGTNTVQLIATDVNGNTDSSSAIVTVEDTIAPEVITQGVTLYLDSTGTAVLTPSVFDNGSNDNCSIDSMSLSQDTFTCSDLGLHVVDLHATDQSGNGATSNALVSVTDTIAPLLRSFSNITVYLDSSGTASIDAGMLDSNSVDNCNLDTIYLSRTTLACADLGSTTVELIGKDRSMNESRLLVNITVEDTLAPSIECPSSFDACAGIVDFPDAVSNDNCTSTVTNTGNVFSGDSLTEGEYVTSFEAVDEAGNVASCTTSFSVNAIPEVDLGADTAVGPGHVVSFSVNDTVSEYLWSTGDTTRSLDLKVLTDTTVWISVTDSNSCTGSDTATVTILTGIKGSEKTLNVSAYPNPTRGEVKVELLGVENLNYHLIDMAGRILQSGNMQSGLNRLDISRYATSVYYLQLQNEQGEGIKVIRLVKQ